MTVQPKLGERLVEAAGPLQLVRRLDGGHDLRLGTAAVAVGAGFAARCVGPHPLDQEQIDTVVGWLAAHAPLVADEAVVRLLRGMTIDPDAVLARHTPWRDLAALVAAARRPHEPPWLRVDIDQGQFFVGVLYDEAMALLGLPHRAHRASWYVHRLVLTLEAGGLVVHYRTKGTPSSAWPRASLDVAAATRMIWPIALSGAERRTIAHWRAERARYTARLTPTREEAVA